MVDLLGDKRALVLGAETTRRNHLVAADPDFVGVEASELSRGAGGGCGCFRFGVRGSPPYPVDFSGDSSEGERDEDPIDWSLPGPPIPSPLYLSCPCPLMLVLVLVLALSSLVGLVSRSFAPFFEGFENNLDLNPPNPGDLAGCPCPLVLVLVLGPIPLIED